MKTMIYIITLLVIVILFIGIVSWPLAKIVWSSDENVPTTVLTPKPNEWSKDNVTIAWLGHAGFLMDLYGTRIVIDPVLEKRIGITPIGNVTIGPKRKQSPPLKAEQIDNTDLLLISHLHSDHFNYPTIRKLQSDNTNVITPKNTSSFWKGLNFNKINEINWREPTTIDGVTIKAIEVKHWGARLPWQKGLGVNGYLISKNGVNIFYSSDTGYTKKIKDQLDEVDVDIAIMGIGAYSPKSFKKNHATPEQSWKIAKEMGAEWIIPMHWGTFKISEEPMDEPMRRFLKAAEGEFDKIAIKQIGGTWVMPKK